MRYSFTLPPPAKGADIAFESIVTHGLGVRLYPRPTSMSYEVECADADLQNVANAAFELFKLDTLTFWNDAAIVTCERTSRARQTGDDR